MPVTLPRPGKTSMLAERLPRGRLMVIDYDRLVQDKETFIALSFSSLLDFRMPATNQRSYTPAVLQRASDLPQSENIESNCYAHPSIKRPSRI